MALSGRSGTRGLTLSLSRLSTVGKQPASRRPATAPPQAATSGPIGGHEAACRSPERPVHSLLHCFDGVLPYVTLCVCRRRRSGALAVRQRTCRRASERACKQASLQASLQASQSLATAINLTPSLSISLPRSGHGSWQWTLDSAGTRASAATCHCQ